MGGAGEGKLDSLLFVDIGLKCLLWSLINSGRVMEWSAGLGAAGGFPGERAGGAGAARLRPHLLLLELPLG